MLFDVLLKLRESIPGISSMSRFGPGPQAFFDAVYRDPAPWDIGEAQPALLQCCCSGVIASPSIRVMANAWSARLGAKPLG